MIKTLTSHGNSAALIIDKPLMELLNITLNTPLKLSTDGNSLIITPINSNEREERFTKALTDVNLRHQNTLKKLAE